MPKQPIFLGLHAQPPKWLRILLGLLPFLTLLLVYHTASQMRLAENPQDKLLPSFGSMYSAVERMAFTKDKRSDEYLMLQDTVSSLRRIAIGVSAATLTGFFIGLTIGMYTGYRRLFLPFVTFLSIIPPLALLPILFITFGVDELAKVMLIFFGTFPVICRDTCLAASRVPIEQITKALTLGASSLQVVYRIILPQLIPRLLDTVRLSLGAAWLFLIASEAIASTDGLGYRIFLVRRYLAMDVIIPYAMWITFIGYIMDLSLRKFVAWKFPWSVTRGE